MMWVKRTMGGCLLAATLAGGCQQDDPFDFGGPADCNVESQNAWVYELMQQAYLWNAELPDIDPSAFETPHDMVAEIRHHPPDRWSRVSDRAKTDALFMEGKILGLGIRTAFDDQDNLRLAEVHEDAPAGRAGLRRPEIIRGIGGYTIAEIDEMDLWSDIFGPNEPGVEVELVVEGSDGQQRTTTIAKDWFVMKTVPTFDVIATPNGPVGYLVFTSFVATSNDELDEAFAAFNAAGVRDVVVDLRYNSGGLISVARHLMNLLVGRATDGVAYKIQYTDNLADQNSERHIDAADHSLPQVRQVMFLTTRSTLSASELVINGIAPHVDVVLVGRSTGGKPVGSRQWPFCDKVAAPITFQLVNADDSGDYFEGFEPDCAATDDLAAALGDPTEGMLAAALFRLDQGSCSPVSEGEELEKARGFELRAATRSLPGAYPELDELRGVY